MGNDEISKLRLRVRELLSEEELQEAFAYPPTFAPLKAVLLVAEAFRERLVDMSTDPTLSDREAAMTAGGIGTMNDFILELYDRMNASYARKEQLQRLEAEKERSEAGG